MLYIIYYIFKGAKNVSWPWLSLLRGWCSVTMTFTGKFVYIYIYRSNAVRFFIFKPDGINPSK